MISGYEKAQIRYDNQMPPEPPAIEDWQVKERMLSDYAKSPLKYFYAPLECASDEDAAKIKSLIMQYLVSPNSCLEKQIGSAIMKVIVADLHMGALYELESGDIDRSLGS